MLRYALVLLGAILGVLWSSPPTVFSVQAGPNSGKNTPNPPPPTPPSNPNPNPTPVARSTADTITLSNESGAAIANYPFQFGRPFVDGAIATAPQVLVGGSAVATQADVKNRYSDGSVQYAVVAVVIPTIPASGSLTLTFQNQAAPNNTPLTQAQMLGSSFNFNTVLSVTGVGAGATAQTVSTRARCWRTATTSCGPRGRWRRP